MKPNPTISINGTDGRIIPFTLTDKYSAYGYRPTEWVTILFIVLFGFSTLLHIGHALIRKTWFMLPTAVIAGILEVIGWGARFMSSEDLFFFMPFQIQIVCTIIGPTPLVAANFIVLGKIIALLGPGYSRLSPRLYAIVFLCGDAISLAVQAVGGGMASAELKDGDPNKGGHVMLGGIIFQFVTITLYIFCATEFVLRYLWDKPLDRASRIPFEPIENGMSGSPHRGVMSRNIKLMLGGLAFNTLCIYIRAIYRTIELSDGWTGRIIRTQIYFNVLDGAMIVLAIYTLNIIHPSILGNMANLTKRTSRSERKDSNGSSTIPMTNMRES